MSVTLANHSLELRLDWTYLFEKDDPIVQRIEVAREKFPLPGDIAVLVDQGTAEQREAFLDVLGERLAKEPQLFFQVSYKIDLQSLLPKSLYYLDEGALEQILKALRGLEKGGSAKANPLNDPQSKKIVLKLLDDFDKAIKTRGRAPYSPVWSALSTPSESNTSQYVDKMLQGERYVFTTIGNGKVNVLLFHTAAWGQESENKSAAIVRIRQILAEMRPTLKDIRVRLTGLPVMLHDERETATQDSLRSGLISALAILIIFAIGFGELSRPILAVLSLLCGLGWTMGYTTLVVGHLNFITISLVTMLMGLGIDFSIHLLFRFDEELARELTPEQALDQTVEGTGLDTFIGATATAAAFLALTQADFRGISEFGVIASGGVMLCFFSTMTVLPSLLALFPGRPRPPADPDGFTAWFERHLLGKARFFSLLGALFLFLCIFWSTKVGFSYNLLEVQAEEIPSVRTELEMVSEFGRSVLSGQVIVPGVAEAREYVDRFRALPAVSGVGSAISLLPAVNPTKQETIEHIVRLLPQLELPPKVPLENASDLLELQDRLQTLGKQATGGHRDQEIAQAVRSINAEVAGVGPGVIQDSLSSFQDNVYQDLGNVLDLLKRQVAVAPQLQDFPSHLTVRYVNPAGEYKLSISAKKNIWEKDNLQEFLGQTLGVAPEMVGHPVVQSHILDAFNRAFQRTPWFTLGGVLLVMALYLRSPKAILLSLLPTATGVLVIFAVMGYSGLEFNVVNFVALPMSVGVGAVYGIHSLHRMRELGNETLLTSSTGPALLLSGVTTMAGFATLMSAHHRGLSSLGFVITVGVAVNFVGSLIFLPALRRALRKPDSENMTLD